MATTKVAGSKTTKTAKKTPARAPAKQAVAKSAAVQVAGRATGAKATSATAAGSAGKASATKVPAKKALAKKAPVAKAATPRVAAKTAAKPVSKVNAASASTGKSRRISPEQALANTRVLLDAKRDHNRQPHSWQTLGPAPSHPGSEGFQSPGAQDKAEELHAAESRLTPIQGSISTRDRHHQGKRDAQ